MVEDDALVRALTAVRNETQVFTEVKVELAQINGSISTLAAEIRTQIMNQSRELSTLRREQEQQEDRLRGVEKIVWKAVGVAAATGSLVGGGAYAGIQAIAGG